jgi:hypothetical protein
MYKLYFKVVLFITPGLWASVGTVFVIQQFPWTCPANIKTNEVPVYVDNKFD